MHSERSVGFKRQAAKIKAVPINILNNNNMYIFVITINQNLFVLFTYVILFFFFRSLKPRLIVLIMGRKKIKISKITDERNRHVRLIYYSIFNCSSFRFVLNVDV